MKIVAEDGVKMREDNEEKILVRGPNWVGDAVMSLPALQELAERDGRGKVDVVCRGSVASVYRRSPSVRRVWELPGKTYIYPKEVRERGYTALVVLPKSWRTAIQAWLSGIPRRYGLGTRWRSFLFTDPTPMRGADRQIHHGRLFYRAAGGLIEEPEELPAPQMTAEQEKGEEIVGAGNYMAIHPGAAYGPAKRWPPAKFGRFLNELVKRHELPVVALGVEAERRLADEIFELAGKSVKSVNLAGETSLDECMDVLAGAALVVANDSGLMHLAAGLGTPTVGIFGSSSPQLTSPLGKHTAVVYAGVECSPCFERECPLEEKRYRCLEEIEVADVLTASEKVWQ